MDLSMSFHHCQMFMQEEPMTDCIFPLVDMFLGNSYRQNAIAVLARRKDTDKYRDLVDFLLYECIAEQRLNIRKYYDGESDLKLRDIIDERTRKLYEARILLVLDACLMIYKRKQRCSWGRIIQIVNKLISK